MFRSYRHIVFSPLKPIRITLTTGQHAPVQPRVCTFKTFMDCKPLPFNGTEGAIGLLHWIEKVEAVFAVCECPPANWVKFATGTLEGSALSWWKAQIQMLGLETANATAWEDFKDMIKEEYCHRDDIHKLEDEYYGLKMVGSEIETYTKLSNDYAALCPNMSRPMYRRIELYVKGLVPEIRSHVTSANLTTIQPVVRLAHKLTNQAVEEGRLPNRISAAEGTPSDGKRKWDGNQGKDANPTQAPAQQRKTENNKGPQQQGGYRGSYPKCNKCNRHHNGACNKSQCQRCNKMGHEAKDCRSQFPARQNQQQPQQQQQQGNNRACFKCGATGHMRKDCPELNQNRNNNQGAGNNEQNNNAGNGARGRAFVIGAGEARNDPNVVAGKFLLDERYVSVLFDSGADASYVSLRISKKLKHPPALLSSKHIVEIANGRNIEATHVIHDCTLELSGHTFSIDLFPVKLGSFDVVIGMDWLSKHRAEILCQEKAVRIPRRSGQPLMFKATKVEKSQALSRF
ncbi:putative transcription factor interactor and regulator CCHC(Zn) family [Helianthus annuus]|nr:putative transcription factor interactor and regulator CCHC(Zn) family [Helianthus annuus]